MSAARGRPWSRRPTVAVALVALVVTAAVVGLVLLVAVGDGGRASRDGALAWAAPPRVMAAPGDRRERILTSTVRNRSAGQIDIEAARVRVVDASGRPLPTSATFLGGFARGVYSGSRLGQASVAERERTGRLARLAPRTSRALTVAWRTAPGRGPAARVEYPGGSLPIPR